MRTEFIITVKHPNGKTDRSSYIGKKWGDDAANKAKSLYGHRVARYIITKVSLSETRFANRNNSFENQHTDKEVMI